MTKKSKTMGGRPIKSSKASTKRIVNKILEARLEKKAIVGDFGSNSTTGGVVEVLSNLAQNDTVFGRTGNVIRVHSLNMTFSSKLTTGAETLRYIVFQDTMNRGVVPSVSDILVTTTYASQYEYIQAQQKRFHVLLDFNHNMTAAGFGFRTSKFRLSPVKDLHFLSAGGAQVDVSKNSLYCLIIGNGTNVGYDVSFTLEFTDA
jgi:hypothetical protein